MRGENLHEMNGLGEENKMTTVVKSGDVKLSYSDVNILGAWWCVIQQRSNAVTILATGAWTKPFPKLRELTLRSFPSIDQASHSLSNTAYAILLLLRSLMIRTTMDPSPLDSFFFHLELDV